MLIPGGKLGAGAAGTGAGGGGAITGGGGLRAVAGGGGIGIDTTAWGGAGTGGWTGAVAAGAAAGVGFPSLSSPIRRSLWARAVIIVPRN